jgi:hypothetical protein
MNYILFVICSIILPIIYSTHNIPKASIKPKLCVNCKYFIPDNDTGKFAKCAFFPREQEAKVDFLVNGLKNDKTDYYYCITARGSKNMCGEEAKYYNKNYIEI